VARSEPTEADRPEGFLLPAEVAEMHGVARETVYGWVRRGIVKKKDVRRTKHPLTDVVLWVWIRASAVAPKKQTA
jgi:transposase-like protein